MSDANPRETMTHGAIPIATIGYEGATVDSFLDALRRDRTVLLVDVRALAMSRRPGFAKSCFEADARHCHRSLVIEALSRTLQLAVTNLAPLERGALTRCPTSRRASDWRIRLSDCPTASRTGEARRASCSSTRR